MKKSTGVFAVAVAAAAGYAANVISAGVRGDGHLGSWVLRLPDAAKRVVAWPPSWSWEPRDLLMAAAATAFSLILLAAWAVTLPQRSGEEHGSARWGRPRDLRPLTDPDIQRNIWLTREHRLRITRARKPEHQRNLNILCIGGSGTGKSRFFVMPNLVRDAGSVLVTDPKGELLATCREDLEATGHRIAVLNLIDFTASDGFNPLAYLRPGHEPEDIALLAKTIIANTDPPQKPTGEPFWERAEEGLMNALISIVVATYPPERQHLGEVMDLLGQMTPDTGDHSPVGALFAAARGLPPEERSELLDYAVAQFQVFRQSVDKTASGILVTTGARLAPLHIPGIRRLVARDTIGLDRVGLEKTAVFAVISDSNKQFAWLSAMLFSAFFQRNVWIADQQPGGMLPVPVTCWLDEFANIGRIPDVDVTMATVRSRGISVIPVVQALNQGKTLYKDAWTTIMANCDTVLFLGSQDQETRKWMAEALGKQTIRTVDSSISHGRRGGGSRNVKTIARELLSADEVGRLPGDEALVLVRGLPPFRGRKLKPLTDRRHGKTRAKKERSR
ncbi:VirD4-like conjugal transfer protein, CD1115 family [Arachnia propionica]|uniref:Type IV secretory system conjugative DNA transfer family protein n=1 Tax=Arachnia propionica TaxID=1750 RepID=A0A3P1WX82_9ACTN|nr:type IV secretory system conjugative DNA transfer family protein [Arachnia propionica]RRD50528.1 type IV secretory system conjugative DNA transfer family protein [Arachnia propionica]